MTITLSHPQVRSSRDRSSGSDARSNDDSQRSTRGHVRGRLELRLSYLMNGRSAVVTASGRRRQPLRHGVVTAACSTRERCFGWSEARRRGHDAAELLRRRRWRAAVWPGASVGWTILWDDLEGGRSDSERYSDSIPGDGLTTLHAFSETDGVACGSVCRERWERLWVDGGWRRFRERHDLRDRVRAAASQPSTASHSVPARP